MNCTAAIVGGGIIGMSIAWRLAQLGWAVTVFEKSTIGSESSWAGAGMLAPGGEVDGPSEWAAFAVESRKLYAGFVRELETASGLLIDYQECGGLTLAYTTEEWAQVQARAAQQASAGIPSKPVTTQQIATLWPRIETTNLAGGQFYPHDAIVNPRDVLAALVAASRTLGITLAENHEVHSIQVSAETAAIDGQAFKIAVIAAGAWSGEIEVTGVAPIPPSEPIKGHLLGYQQPAQTCGTILRHGHTYLLQRANGLLIVGASVEHVGFDRQVRPEPAAQLATEAGRLLPHLKETTPTETWIGFRPGSDALHLGSWQNTALYLAYGHYRNGILLAPITADRIVAETLSA